MSLMSEKETMATIENFEKAPSTESQAPIDAALEKKLVRKVDRNLIPVLFVLLLLAFLDRVNIGNARIQGLEADLNMHGTDYNVALFIFFITYITFEIPSNIVLKKLRPSIWLSGIIFCWGLVTTLQGVSQSFGGLVACRLLLGAFEAGFFPGAIYLISMYYKRYETQFRVTLFFSGSIIAGAFSGLLAYGIAGMQGDAGYSAWRWIFILEGAATCVIAAISYFFIPDWPETARFLTDDDRALLIRRLAEDTGKGQMSTYNKKAVVRSLKDIKIYLYALMYLGVGVTGYSSSFFIPTILAELGWTSVRAQVMSIPIYCCATSVTLLVSFISDRVKHRYGFIMLGCMIATIGYIILLNTASISIQIRYMATFFIPTGGWVAQPVILSWLNNNMGGHYKRGVGTAFVIGCGNIAGLIASNIYLSKEAPYYKTGYGTGLGFIAVLAIAATTNLFYLKWENKQRDQGKRDHLLSLPADELANLGDDHPTFRFIY